MEGIVGFPGARLLVVDDIATNLKIAECLLAPYRITVDTCLSGLQAIEMVKQRDYDIVLMDHIMPEMDGIEATALIRTWESSVTRKQVPIIALTANAVVGMREMFIEKGFNDFLSKPMGMSKLDEILNRWIAKKKIINSKEQITDTNSSLHIANCSLFTIPGVDTARGIAMTGGTEGRYCSVLLTFCADAEDRLPLLQKVSEASALPTFVSQVHALKSASAAIGAAQVSAMATELEAAGKAEDIAFIQENLSVFTKSLAELVKNIRHSLEQDKPECQDVPRSQFPVPQSFHYSRLFDELAEALKSQNASEVGRILDELDQTQLDSKTRKTVDKISEDVLMAEYGNALKKIINDKYRITNYKEQIANKNDNSSFSTEIEARRLDSLNHYRAAFELDKTGAALKFDAGYYRRFVSVVESFDALPNNMKAERELLIEAGRNEDAQKICETLPAFYENLAAIYRGKRDNEGTENEMAGLILHRLKIAILDGDTNTAGKTLKELGAESLNPAERELYFMLYDSLMDDNTAKALEIIERHLVD